MTPSKPHTHDFQPKEKKVLLHNESKLATGESEVGGNVSAVDMLKQLVCECGESSTVDLKRKKM